LATDNLTRGSDWFKYLSAVDVNWPFNFRLKQKFIRNLSWETSREELEDIGESEMVILKCILNKRGVTVWIELSWLRIQHLGGCSEHGSELWVPQTAPNFSTS